MKKHFTSALFAVFLSVSSNINAQTIPVPDHVVIVMMENYAYNDIIGNTANAPYINALASDPNTALFTNSVALTHPSQPNYLMLYSGSNQGVTSDAISPTQFTTCNLGASIIAKGKTFAGYSESLPSVGSLTATAGNYARKHCPWTNWIGNGVNQLPPSVHQQYTSFPTSSTYSTLPTVSFVIPNLADDMHNPTTNSVTAISNGDTWFNNNINAYAQWAKTHNSLLILTWDEDDSTTGPNQIVTMFVGQMVQGGSYSEAVNHYRVLRTLEDMFGVTTYCGASSTSTPITDCWKTTTDINQLNSLNISLNVWPVPSKEILNIEIQSGEYGPSLISVCDLSGRIIKQQEVYLQKTGNSFQFDVKDVSAGIYFVKVTGTVNTSKKIIIGH